MNLNTLFVFGAILGGMLIAAQGIVNGRLSSHLGGPLPAAFVSFSVGLVALTLLNIVTGTKIPGVKTLESIPLWAFVGGLLGTYVVVLAAAAVPRIGVATHVSAMIAGQLTAAIIYDHYGFLGQQVREATPLRLLGVAFLAVGVYMIRRF